MNLQKILVLLLFMAFFINCQKKSQAKETTSQTKEEVAEPTTDETATSDNVSRMKRILIFTKTKGYRHTSIETGIQAIAELSKGYDFNVSDTDNSDYIHFDTLKKFDAVLFLNTTGDILTSLEQKHFKAFINTGGGFIGIHAAADTEYEWPWYGKLVGAYFDSHPPGLHKATIQVLDTTHLATKNVPKSWSHKDEWYNYKNISPDIHVLANLDETSYTGGTNGANHPIAWVQEYDGGKMFYTGLGHPEEAYSDEHFLAHVLGGMRYVLDL